jgi:hypothetical protein
MLQHRLHYLTLVQKRLKVGTNPPTMAAIDE